MVYHNYMSVTPTLCMEAASENKTVLKHLTTEKENVPVQKSQKLL